MSKKGIMFLIAESSIHTGSGEDVGYVDQPIQRSKFNDFPIIQPGEVKGALRDYLEDKGFGEEVEVIFGPENSGNFASAVSFGEARLLFLPVKSLYGVYAYLTCPYLLNRFLKEASFQISFGNLVSEEKVVVLDNSIVSRDKKVILQEYPFSTENDYTIPTFEGNGFFEWLKDKLYPADESYKYWKENFLKRVVIISDSMMNVFTQIGVEIVTRNRIGESGTVSSEGGNLWTEENLPEETIMYFHFEAFEPFGEPNEKIKTEDNVYSFIKSNLNSKILQLGGNKTIGRGFVLVKHLDF